MIFLVIIIHRLSISTGSEETLPVCSNPSGKRVNNAFTKRYTKMIANLGPVKGGY